VDLAVSREGSVDAWPSVIDRVGHSSSIKQSISGCISFYPYVAGDLHRDRFVEDFRILFQEFRERRRLMSRVRTAGSLFWGLMLLAAGGLLLARNLGYPIPIFTGVARYWPVVLIIWGAFKLVDYYRYRETGGAQSLFSAGEVVLLIFIILIGSAITVAANMSPDLRNILHVGDIDIWQITGNSYEYSEHHEADGSPGSSIAIANVYGGVEVTAAETDHIVVDVKKTVIAFDQSEADRLAGRLTFSIKNE
jgi:hypothetical protein